jgi:hypothetical protein
MGFSCDQHLLEVKTQQCMCTHYSQHIQSNAHQFALPSVEKIGGSVAQPELIA